MIRPEASRVVQWTVPPVVFWCSMVTVIRPEESRTTSRQVCAIEPVERAKEHRAGKRSAFMVFLTVDDKVPFNADTPV